MTRLIRSVVIVALGIAATLWLTFSFILPELLFLKFEESTIVLVPSNPDAERQLVLAARLHPTYEDSVVVPVLGDTEVSVISGFGEYELRSVYPLLHLSIKDQPEATAVYGHIFGSLVDTVVAHPNITQEAFASNDFKNELFWRGIRGFGTDPQWADLLRMYYALQSGSIEAIATPDAVHATIAAPGALDASVIQNCPVVVVNTTTEPGLARTITDSFEENGVFVVRTISETPTVERTIVLIDSSVIETCEPIAEKISVFFPDPPEREVREDLESYYRGTVIILLGNDTAAALSGE